MSVLPRVTEWSRFCIIYTGVEKLHWGIVFPVSDCTDIRFNYQAKKVYFSIFQDTVMFKELCKTWISRAVKSASNM